MTGTSLCSVNTPTPVCHTPKSSTIQHFTIEKISQKKPHGTALPWSIFPSHKIQENVLKCKFRFSFVIKSYSLTTIFSPLQMITSSSSSSLPSSSSSSSPEISSICFHREVSSSESEELLLDSPTGLQVIRPKGC